MRKTIFICIIATVISLIVLCIYGGACISFGITILKDIQQNSETIVDSKTVTNEMTDVESTETRDSIDFIITEIKEVDYIRTQLHETKYHRYYNSRFDYSITYPSCFIHQEESANGDGCRLALNEEIYLSVFGSNNISNEVIADRFYENDISSVAYSRLKNNWFVISDYTSDGRIFYQKTVLKNGIFITAILYYPSKYKNDFQEITQRIFSKFPE